MILICGEALMDVYRHGDTAQGCALDARIGGSPLNVAIGLARLGQGVNFFGGVSRDALGERLLRALREERVGDSTVVRFDAPTTLSVVDVNAEGQPSYAFHGSGAADRLLRPTDVDAVTAQHALIHVGSYAVVVEPIASALRHLIERERGRAIVSFDPNVRPTVEPNLRRWRTAIEWMVPRTDLLKVSAEDVGLLYPRMPLDVLVRSWLKRGVGLVVVTLGERGALGFTAMCQVNVQSCPCKLVDSVGAGDTFQAALLTWLAEHGVESGGDLRALTAVEIQDALQFSSRAAAVTCSRRGADMPRRADLTGL